MRGREDKGCRPLIRGRLEKEQSSTQRDRGFCLQGTSSSSIKVQSGLPAASARATTELVCCTLLHYSFTKRGRADWVAQKDKTFTCGVEGGCLSRGETLHD